MIDKANEYPGPLIAPRGCVIPNFLLYIVSGVINDIIRLVCGMDGGIVVGGDASIAVNDDEG